MAGDYLSIGNPSQCSSSNEPWPWQPGKLTFTNTIVI